jgi:hypothetical protein
MGNYKDLEYEFVERSLALIEQYNNISSELEFKKQYNHTLLINCLLGLIVLPKERIITYIPNDRLTLEIRKRIGLENSIIHDEINTLRDLIIKLRHAVAHFNIKVISNDDDFLIDEIVFMDRNNEIIRFRANELLPFIKYYSDWLLQNLNQHRQNSNT